MTHFFNKLGILPFFASLACWLLWYIEIHWFIPQTSSTWLKAPLYSIYPIIGIISLVYLKPISTNKKPLIQLIYWLLLSITSLASFYLAKYIFYQLYGALPTQINHNNLIARSIWLFMSLTFVLSCIFYLPLYHLKQNKEPALIFTLMVVLINIIPFSLICMDFTPAQLIPHSNNFHDAVYIGFPCFLTTLFLGIFSQLVTNKK